jgi:hypothetical protein
MSVSIRECIFVLVLSIFLLICSVFDIDNRWRIPRGGRRTIVASRPRSSLEHRSRRVLGYPILNGLGNLSCNCIWEIEVGRSVSPSFLA